MVEPNVRHDYNPIIMSLSMLFANFVNATIFQISMPIIKHNLCLVPSSWFRWALFCKLMQKTVHNHSDEEKLQKTIYPRLYTEISSSRISNIPLAVFDEEDDSGLKGLWYYAHFLAEQTASLLSFNCFDESEIKYIESEFRKSEEITDFAINNLLPGLDYRHEINQYDIDGSQFSFFPSLKGLWEGLCTKWEILEIPEKATAFSSYELFLLIIGETNTISWKLQYETLPESINLSLKPLAKKTISFYTLLVSLARCSNFKEDKKEWINCVKNLDWTNYPVDWNIYYCDEGTSSLKYESGSNVSNDTLSALLSRPIFNQAINIDSLINTDASATRISIRKLWDKISIIAEETPERLYILRDSVVAELHFFRDNQLKISNSFISPEREQELVFYNEVFIEKMETADAWFNIDAILNFNKEESLLQLQDWVDNFSNATLLPHECRINSETIESLIDTYIQEDSIAKDFLDEQIELQKLCSKDAPESNEETYTIENNKDIWPNKSLKETLGNELTDEQYQLIHNHCSETCEIFPNHKTQFIRTLLETEVFSPTIGWKDHLMLIHRDYLPSNEFNFNDITSCKLSSIKQYQKWFFKKEDFNCNDFSTKYIFIETKKNGTKTLLRGEDMFRELKDSPVLPNIVRRKIQEYFISKEK